MNSSLKKKIYYCPRCKDNKSILQFPTNSLWCIECRKEVNKIYWQEYYKKHKQKILSKNRKYNKEYNKQYVKSWLKNHPYMAKFYSASRRVAKQKRTPKWADLEKIKQIYLKCPRRKVVDHIIPLRGKYVSGLHVHNNLQYLTRRQNNKKHNQFNILS